MSFITRESLIQSNVEKAIQQTFNINKGGPGGPAGPSCHLVDTGVEISGFAVVSQEARELNDIIKSMGCDYYGLYDFAPNGNWSVLNLNKIKVQWAVRCQQYRDNHGKIWNILPGSWASESEFQPDMLSEHVKVIITVPGRQLNCDKGYALVPYENYTTQRNIAEIVPNIRFDKKQLDCIHPRSMGTVSINRRGIYINRKYREKIEIVDLQDQEYPRVSKGRIDIYYKGKLLETVP